MTPVIEFGQKVYLAGTVSNRRPIAQNSSEPDVFQWSRGRTAIHKVPGDRVSQMKCVMTVEMHDQKVRMDHKSINVLPMRLA
jgi:hypothetical protein